jgi:hypothetical protein
MYANTFLPVVNFTLATLRCAEFGFFGFIVMTDNVTPFR